MPRGKRLRRRELMAVYENGRFLPGSILVCDITGRDCEETGLVWEDGDADRLAWPAPGTLVPAPWLGEDVAQVITSLYELDGTPNDLDPRHVLRRVLERFAADGLTPVVACELEYYLVDARRTRPAASSWPARRRTGERPTQHGVYGLRELEDFGGFLRELWACADAQGVPLEGAISEYAPGQLELTLRHGPDALRAADEAVMYKRIAKGVAAGHGCEATFMAKPFAERSGSGLHLHVSVNDADGRNIFASDDPAGAPALRHAVGGLKATAGRGMAIFAPNANSYRRFRANSYAPVAPTWGVNNRTVSLRVPAGPPAGRHIEHRVAGRRRQSLPGPGRAAGRRASWPHRARSIPGRRSSATAMPPRRPATERLPATLVRGRRRLRGLGGHAGLSGRAVRRRCSPRSSAPSRTASSRSVPPLDYDWCLKNA